MVPRLLYIVAFLIQYQAANIIVTAGKKVQANAPRTTEPAKNYGMSVKKWLALDRHKVKCSDSVRLTSSSNGFANFFNSESTNCFRETEFDYLFLCSMNVNNNNQFRRFAVSKYS